VPVIFGEGNGCLQQDPYRFCHRDFLPTKVLSLCLAQLRPASATGTRDRLRVW
jgi:hypothetical protein